MSVLVVISFGDNTALGVGVVDTETPESIAGAMAGLVNMAPHHVADWAARVMSETDTESLTPVEIKGRE